MSSSQYVTHVPRQVGIPQQSLVWRMKTIQALRLPGNPTLNEVLKKAVNNFCSLDFATATNVAMQLTYTPLGPDPHYSFERALNKIGLTIYSEKCHGSVPNLDLVERESIPIIISEAVHHNMHREDKPGFLATESPTGCDEEFEKLKNAVTEPALCYCIMRTLLNCAKKKNADELVQALRSTSEVDRKAALIAMDQKHIYLRAMLPYALVIADMLSAMFEQSRLYQQHVTQEPEKRQYHHKEYLNAAQKAPNAQKAHVPQEVPAELLTDVPAFAVLAPYIPHQEQLSKFITEHMELLAGINKWVTYGLSVTVILGNYQITHTPDGKTISGNFRKQFYELCAKVLNTNVENTDVLNKNVDAFGSACAHLPKLLPTANTLLNAFCTARVLHEKHNAVCRMKPDPNNPAYLDAVKALYFETEKAKSNPTKYEAAIRAFNQALSEHPLQPLQTK